jgi:uncharacterized protein (DUF924 family)
VTAHASSAVASFKERHFLIMPFLHAENVAHVERAAVEFERNARLSPSWGRFLAEAGMEQSRKYADVLRRFGRFPHRNAALDRASTPDEEAFLKDWSQKAPPSVRRIHHDAGSMAPGHVARAASKHPRRIS